MQVGKPNPHLSGLDQKCGELSGGFVAFFPVLILLVRIAHTSGLSHCLSIMRRPRHALAPKSCLQDMFMSAFNESGSYRKVFGNNRRIAPQARRTKRLSQTELANLLGISAKAVDYYERRAKNPSLAFVRQAAEALNVPFEDLTGTSTQAASKPGPSKKLLRQLEQIQHLPKNKQRFVSELLDTVLQSDRS